MRLPPRSVGPWTTSCTPAWCSSSSATPLKVSWFQRAPSRSLWTACLSGQKLSPEEYLNLRNSFKSLTTISKWTPAKITWRPVEEGVATEVHSETSYKNLFPILHIVMLQWVLKSIRFFKIKLHIFSYIWWQPNPILFINIPTLQVIHLKHTHIFEPKDFGFFSIVKSKRSPYLLVIYFLLLHTNFFD